MSRTRKDGRSGGAHRSNRGMEWGSRRGPLGWKDAGPWMKRLTHRMERRAARALSHIRDGWNLSKHAFPPLAARPRGPGGDANG